MTRLSLEERIEIKALLNANISKPKIAAQLRRSKMTDLTHEFGTVFN